MKSVNRIKKRASFRLRNFIVAIFCGLMAPAYAQDFKADLQKIADHLKQVKHLDMGLEVKVFASLTSSEVVSLQQFSLKKSGDRYFYSGPSGKVLYNERYKIVVDDDHKTILYEKRDLKAEKEGQALLAQVPDLDSMFSTYKKVEYLGLDKGMKHYRVHLKEGMISKAELFIHSSGLYPARLIYYYNTQDFPQHNKAELTYHRFNFSPDFSRDEFSEKKIIRREGKKIQGAGKYASYTVLNSKSEDYE